MPFDLDFSENSLFFATVMSSIIVVVVVGFLTGVWIRRDKNDG